MICRRPRQKHVAEKSHTRRLNQLRREEMDVGNGRGIRLDVIRYRKARNAGAINRQRVQLMQGRYGVAGENLIAVAEIMIQSKPALVVVVRQQLGGREKIPADI